MENTNHKLYDAALAADKAYADAITEVSGGKRGRWTLTVEDEANPILARALAAKIAADAAWSKQVRDIFVSITEANMERAEHVNCSRCGKKVSGVDPDLGLVVRAWVECPECIDAWRDYLQARAVVLAEVQEKRTEYGYDIAGFDRWLECMIAVEARELSARKGEAL